MKQGHGLPCCLFVGLFLKRGVVRETKPSALDGTEEAGLKGWFADLKKLARAVEKGVFDVSEEFGCVRAILQLARSRHTTR